MTIDRIDITAQLFALQDKAYVTIGDNCTIGAGSVVTHDIPANSVAVGNPAKVIKTI